jgi:raffinose/stachyose/melibiose transport system substrate-binding protein
MRGFRTRAKALAAVGAVLVLALAVAVGASAKGNEDITLTMWSYDNQDPGLQPVLQQLSKNFERSHPGVKINIVFKAFNDLVGTVPRALASGSGPDVTEGNQGYQTDAQLVKAKLIIPLTKYVKKYRWDKLYAPSTWGMFRWTADGKSFGKGPVWGIAQTGQNVVAFINKKKLVAAGINPNKMPTTFAGWEKMLAQLRAKLPSDEPVIMAGNKEGYGFIHMFGGVWGASTSAQSVRNWIYHVPGSRYDTPGTIKALGRLQAWAKNGYFNEDYNAQGNDASAGVFAKGTGAMWIGGDWDSTIIKTGLGAKNVLVMPVPAGPSGKSASIGGLSGPWHISAKTKYPDLGAEWLNYVIATPIAHKLMFSQQQLPSDRRAKLPTNDPYLGQVYNAFAKVANDDGLLLYTDWASPSMYTTLQNQFQLLLAGKTSPSGMAKAVQADWEKFDKTLR